MKKLNPRTRIDIPSGEVEPISIFHQCSERNALHVSLPKNVQSPLVDVG